MTIYVFINSYIIFYFSIAYFSSYMVISIYHCILHLLIFLISWFQGGNPDKVFHMIIYSCKAGVTNKQLEYL